MDRKQALFEQLTLSEFKKWNSTALKTFNNYTIMMTNNSNKVTKSMFLSHLLIFDSIWQPAAVNFICI